MIDALTERGIDNCQFNGRKVIFNSEKIEEKLEAIFLITFKKVTY
jgi:hypothetical protein